MAPLRFVLSILCLMLLSGSLAPAAEPEKSAPETDASDFPVAAYVNGEPIYVAQVENLLKTVQRQHAIEPDQLNEAKAEALRQIVERRLMTIAFRRDGAYVSDADIERDLEKVRAQAKQRGMSVEGFLNRNQMTLDAARYEIAWKLGSQKFIDQHLADALEGYFKEHHREFDGTQIRASHILLRPSRFSESPAQVAQRAKALRDDIEAGKISFEDAAAKYSVGPSRLEKGDVGFFPRFGVMQEEFAKAAFALEPGEISQPVITPFGVHLIRTGESKPGNRQWTQAVEQLKTPASLDLYAKLLEKEQADAKVEYTGKWPYLKPGTKEKEVILPEAAASSEAK